MQTTKLIWQNGQFIPWEEAKVHVLSHTFNDKLLGQGVVDPITAQIKQAYLDVVHGRDNEFKHYLTYTF